FPSLLKPSYAFSPIHLSFLSFFHPFDVWIFFLLYETTNVSLCAIFLPFSFHVLLLHLPLLLLLLLLLVYLSDKPSISY
ncbi:hypothetical protein CSUI_007770, partial [Cystoisospora suis]